jgi:flagellar biogenesis protein FliO
MLIEDISNSQILTAAMFIVVLVAIQIYITKNKNTLKGKWASNRRIVLTDSTRLGPTEKVQIIKVDDFEYLYFFSKGNQPVILPMQAVDKSVPLETIKSHARTAPVSRAKRNFPKNPLPIKTGETPQAESKIIQAISVARKQNPKVSFE